MRVASMRWACKHRNHFQQEEALPTRSFSREGEEIADEIDLQQIIPDEPLDTSSKDK